LPLEWVDGVAGEREGAFVDAGAVLLGELLIFAVGVVEHFKFGVEVVDVMEGEGFWGAWKGGRSEFVSAVVGSDEVEEMKEEEVVVGAEVIPGGVLFEEFTPEVAADLHAEGDVAEHFTFEGVVLGERGGVVGVFPEFPAVMEKDADVEEVEVERGVSGGEGVGAAHHLGDVLDKAAAAGVVVFAGGGGAAEGGAVSGDEVLTQGMEAGVLDLFKESENSFVVAGLSGVEGRVTGEHLFEILGGGVGEGPIGAVDAVFVLGPASEEFEGVASVEGGEFFKLAVV